MTIDMVFALFDRSEVAREDMLNHEQVHEKSHQKKKKPLT